MATGTRKNMWAECRNKKPGSLNQVDSKHMLDELHVYQHHLQQDHLHVIHANILRLNCSHRSASRMHHEAIQIKLQSSHKKFGHDETFLSHLYSHYAYTLVRAAAHAVCFPLFPL